MKYIPKEGDRFEAFVITSEGRGYMTKGGDDCLCTAGQANTGLLYHCLKATDSEGFERKFHKDKFHFVRKQ